jgi:hypothetical protein
MGQDGRTLLRLGNHLQHMNEFRRTTVLETITTGTIHCAFVSVQIKKNPTKPHKTLNSKTAFTYEEETGQ